LQERHQTLGPFTDMTVIDAVFREGLSGRSPASRGGGGLSKLARTVVEDWQGEVWVRSGFGLVRLAGFEKGKSRGRRLGAGYGTQVRISLPSAR
jgi:hypothetical protein